ncbi:outer membrane protein [Nitratireductor pacificus]|uniref:outer membrane protein n=1 Tax=Nitratireductor pacificus TaxID=1231180 RepID=UPI000592D814|nr:outer membrane beta-barrel protein [Nitratireductor pacificus]
MPLYKNSIPVILAVLTAIAGTPRTMAADLTSDLPPEPPELKVPNLGAISAPIMDWEGGYAGIAAGYGFSGEVDPRALTISPKGFITNGFLGWNRQSGRFVYGPEADLGYSAVNASEGGYTAKGRFDGTLRARIGYTIELLLPYVTAGGAFGRLRLEEAGRTDTETLLGWTAGAGMDIKFSSRMFGRVEYRYTEYGDKTFLTGSGSTSASWSNNKVLFGIGMEF